ncbi:hypothetical protein [Methylobacterium sp. 37f]|uniref:DUF7940 domain-containing protein n=1 Tax=Methylobacterium sp. 37f TaxID=2817058 RepID=UPI001FFCA2E0|nr:hypothetical protein [Methylobacterium sp. 37f]MCK2057175.1 hypothetical protein [Methylobacterium sp. 37f]
MRLVDNWRRVVRNAWSLRLSILATVLSGAEIVVQVFLSDPPIPKGIFAVLAMLVTIASGVARLFAQPSVSGSADA